jgi:hypothetical protein
MFKGKNPADSLIYPYLYLGVRVKIYSDTSPDLLYPLIL